PSPGLNSGSGVQASQSSWFSSSESSPSVRSVTSSPGSSGQPPPASEEPPPRHTTAQTSSGVSLPSSSCQMMGIPDSALTSLVLSSVGLAYSCDSSLNSTLTHESPMRIAL